MANLRPKLEVEPPKLATQQTIVGAATPLDHKKRRKGKPVTEHWQHKAYQYYDEINEVYYGANFTGNCLARIRLVGAEESGSLSEPPRETKNKAIADAVRNFTNNRSGQSGLLRRFGQNMFLAGEVFIHGDEDEDGEQNWEVYSTLELQDHGNGIYTINRQLGDEDEYLTTGTMVTRVWKEHPKKAFDPDSAMRTCAKDCEKLLILEKQDLSVAKSRFAGAGILLFPTEIIPPAIVDDEGNVDENPANSPFIQSIQNSMVEPIIGTEQPEDIVPSIVTGQAEYLKEIRHFTMEKPINPYSEEQKMATVRRMATAMDLPNEVLLGLEDTNHWTAWQIKEETFQTHIRPFVEMICNSLTVAYLWPQLKNNGVKDYKKYIVWYDDTNLVARPDKSIAAQKAYEGIAISEEAYRREMGFNEDDAPDDEEWLRRAALAMRVKEALFLLDGDEDPDLSRGKGPHEAKTPYPQDKSRPDPDTPGPAKSALPGSPEAEKQTANSLQASASTGTFTPQAVGYLEAAIDRAREKAGAKVRTLIPKNSELANIIADLPNEQVYSSLSEQDKSKYGIRDDIFFDFDPAVAWLKDNGISSEYDWKTFKTTMREEAIRKSKQGKGNFFLNLDKFPK